MSEGSGNQAVRRLESVGVRRLVVIACGLTLVAIVLMIWSVLDPTPLPVMVVMSLGQVFGTGGLLCYLAAVLVHRLVEARSSAREQKVEARSSAHERDETKVSPPK